jgi:uncharacterized protein YdeI (BOF family)
MATNLSVIPPGITNSGVTNIGDLQVREGFFVLIAGTVVAVRNDEFLLQDATGQVLVDAVRGGLGTIALTPGEQVTVIGDLDDPVDFDALRIFRADGSEVIGQRLSNPGRPGTGFPPFLGPFPPFSIPGNPGNNLPIDVGSVPLVNIGDLQVRDDFFVTIRGTVLGVREDEFLLQDATGQVLVDAVRGRGRINLIPGEQVTVIGDLDDPVDFDALRIFRADGSEVIGQSIGFPNPPGGFGGEDGPDGRGPGGRGPGGRGPGGRGPGGRGPGGRGRGNGLGNQPVFNSVSNPVGQDGFYGVPGYELGASPIEDWLAGDGAGTSDSVFASTGVSRGRMTSTSPWVDFLASNPVFPGSENAALPLASPDMQTPAAILGVGL